MTNDPQLKHQSSEPAMLVSKTLRELQRVAITSEERIRRRIRSSVRIAVASALFCISGIVSFGINVTTAFAGKATHHTESKVRRARSHNRHHHHWRHAATLARVAHSPVANPAIPGASQTGLASWYGGKFQHRRTASGKAFDTHTLTAAHRSLPFGTKVLVTNLANNQTCVVEITDRGPYVGSRIIDLSYAAATELGFAGSGTARVKIEPLKTPVPGQGAEGLADLAGAAFVP